MKKLNYRRFSLIRIIIISLMTGGLSFYTSKYQEAVVAQTNLNGAILHDYDDYYVLAPKQMANSFNLPQFYNGKEIRYWDFIKDNPSYSYVRYYHAFNDVEIEYELGFFKKNVSISLKHIPHREGYTFYGWWTSLDRAKGEEVINQRDEVNQNASFEDGALLYPMFFDSSYVFIDKTLPANLEPNQNYALISNINLATASFPGFSVNYSHNVTASYNGVFDGNYFTISNLNIDVTRQSAGLFVSVGEKGVIKNLALTGRVMVTHNSASFHAFGAGVAAFNNGTITNVKSSVTVIVKNNLGVSFAGGIAASIGYNGSNKGTIYNAVNEGAVSADGFDSFAAGILATNGQFYENLFVYQTINRGRISTKGSSATNTTAGGIVSHGVVGAKYSLNSGDVTTTTSFNSSLGGISGYIRNTDMHNKPPVDCVYLKEFYFNTQYAIGAYPGDINSATNNGNLVGSSPTEAMVNTLNQNQKVFVLNDNIISLSFENNFISK